jgi:hypothetical protein
MSHSWFFARFCQPNRFRRLTVRYERRADILEGLHRLAAALICFGFIRRWHC